MLSILLLYFIGKSFYSLAEAHNKSKWGFGILGVINFYVGAMIGGIFIGITDVIFDTNILDSNDTIITLIAIPFGLLAWAGLYYLLKHLWEKKRNQGAHLIDEIGKEDIPLPPSTL